MAKHLWFLVDHNTNNPVTLYINEVNAVTISPYVFTSERGAREALDERWPEEAAERLVARSGVSDLFLHVLAEGFIDTKPTKPDCFSLNPEKGEILGGLVPVTRTGAGFLDNKMGKDFWSLLSEIQLRKHAQQMILLAMGEHVGI